MSRRTSTAGPPTRPSNRISTSVSLTSGDANCASCGAAAATGGGTAAADGDVPAATAAASTSAGSGAAAAPAAASSPRCWLLRTLKRLPRLAGLEDLIDGCKVEMVEYNHRDRRRW